MNQTNCAVTPETLVSEAYAEQTTLNASAKGEDLYRLGLQYSSGQARPIDYVQAHKWFNLAAMKGLEAAKQYRRELADLMTRAEIAAAQRAAREWLDLARV